MMKLKTSVNGSFELGSIRRSEFENGSVFLHHRPKGFSGAYLCCWFLVGSRFESLKQSGITHLIEHLVFRGRSQKDDSLYTSNIEMLGGELNAWTSKEETCFEVQGLGQKMSSIFPHFLSMVFSPSIVKSDLDKEKNIVVQEIKEDCDDIELYAQERLFEKAYTFPLGHSVSGSIGSVLKLSDDQIKKYIKKYFVPERMVVTVVSNDNPVKYEKILSKFFMDNGLDKKSRPWRKKLPKSWKPIMPFKSKLKRECELCSLQWTVSAPALGHKDRASMNMLNYALTGGMNSILFKRLREQEGLVYGISSDIFSFTDHGNFLISVSCPKKSLARVVKNIENELHKIAENENSIEHWDATVAGLTGYLHLRLDDLVERSCQMAYAEFYRGRAVTLKDQKLLIEKVRPKDIQRIVTKMLARGHSSVTVVPKTGE